MLRFRLLIYFLSYTRSLKCGQLQDWKTQVGCMLNVIGFRKFLLSSVNEFKTYQSIPFNIHTVQWFESRKLFEYYKKRSCVSNRTDTSALSEWMVVRPFRSLVQLRSESSESASQTYNHFYNIPPIISAFKLQIRTFLL